MNPSDITPSAILVSIGLVLSCFSGNWQYVGIPLPIDRVLLLVGFVVAFRGHSRAAVTLRFTIAHVAVGILCFWTVTSALVVGTAFTPEGVFALLDRLGIVPFVLLFTAPLVFRTSADRLFLLKGLVVLGVYLSTVSILDAFDLPGVWPAYINDVSLGYHAERARGPYLEAVANGLMLIATAIAALTVYFSTVSKAWRLVALLMVGAGMFALLLTLTRAAWLAAVVSIVAFAILETRSRRPILLLMSFAGIASLGLVLAAPALFVSVGERAGEERPVWDRLNTNRAAIEMIEAHPIAGVGWQNAASIMEDYVRQADSYPTTGAGTPIHNVPLSRAAELGLPGLLAWVAAIGVLVGCTYRQSSPEPEFQRLRLMSLCFTVAFLTVAMFGPLPYAQPNYLLGVFIGVCLTTWLTDENSLRASLRKPDVDPGPPIA